MEFCNRLIRLTPAEAEQDHLHLLIDNNPKAPDRNLAIAGKGPTPCDSFAKSAGMLEAMGADFLVMPCNTAHAFAHCITKAVTIPLLNIINQVAISIAPNLEKIGLLAVNGCLESNLYQSAFDIEGKQAVCLSPIRQQDFMQLIYRIKREGISADVFAQMRQFAHELIDGGAECVVAGCTEVPLVLKPEDLQVPFYDSVEILARETVRYARSQTSPAEEVNSETVVMSI